MHVDLIGSYINSIIQQQPCSATIKSNVSLTCMPMIYHELGWFEIVEVPKFDLDEVMISNDE